MVNIEKFCIFSYAFTNSADHPSHTPHSSTAIPHLESCKISKSFVIRQLKAVLSLPFEMQGRFYSSLDRVISGPICEWCWGRSTIVSEYHENRAFHLLAVLDDCDIVDNVVPAGFFVIHHFQPSFFLSFFPDIRLSSRRFLALGTELGKGIWG